MISDSRRYSKENEPLIEKPLSLFVLDFEIRKILAALGKLEEEAIYVRSDTY